MSAVDRQSKTFALLLRIRLLLEAGLGLVLLLFGIRALSSGAGRDLLQALGFILIVAAFFFPIARSLGFVVLAGVGSRRLQRQPDQPPSLILLAAVLDLPMLLAFVLGSGALPWPGTVSTGLALVLLIWDVALIVSTLRMTPSRTPTAEGTAARPTSIVLRAAPLLANAMCLIFLVQFATATQHVAPPHELRIDKIPEVPKVPTVVTGLRNPVADETALWSLRSGMGTTELVRLDLERYVMQYRYPLPKEIASVSTDLRGMLRHPSGERLLLIHNHERDLLYVLAAKPEGGVRVVLSLAPVAKWATQPLDPERRYDRLMIMGWTLSGERLEFVSQSCLYFEYETGSASGQITGVRRLPGCDDRFDEVRWARRERDGWHLLIEKKSARTWSLTGPAGAQPIPGIADNIDLRIDMSPGNILSSSSLPPQYVFIGGKLVALKPPPPVPSDFVVTGGLPTLAAEGLHHSPYFCRARQYPCALPWGSDWIRADTEHDGLQLSSDLSTPGVQVAPRHVSTVFVPYFVPVGERAWLVTQSDSYVLELRRPLQLVPISLMARIRRLVPTDEESLQLKVRWLGAKAGGYEGVDSLQSAMIWNIIKYLPLPVGPMFTLIFLLLRRDPRSQRLLQILALGYLMLCVIGGPLLLTELDAF